MPDLREHDYGYVQFRLYKEASYPGGRAVGDDPLTYLRDATKIKVTLGYGDDLIYQTLTFSYSDAESAEYGIRSEKLKLLTGEYTLLSYVLYDNKDEAVYANRLPSGSFEIVAGGLHVHEITADVKERGKVRFSLVKDMSSFDSPEVKAEASRPDVGYTFDQIAYVTLTVKNLSTKKDTTFNRLPAKFSIHFDEDDVYSDSLGYQMSSIKCDTLLTLEGGDYELVSYTTLSKAKKTLEINPSPSYCGFSISDNQITDVKVPITMVETDPYIQDYYALYNIWTALHGKEWYYVGENFPTGSNWNFNKDVDLWGDQPGVQLHSNGRVALIDLSNFGFYGEMPDDIGTLTALVELYLGTHDDTNLYTYGSGSYAPSITSKTRMDKGMDYLHKIHPATQFSEPIARALAEKGVRIRETEMYDKFSEAQIIDNKTGLMKAQLFDVNAGVKANGLTRISDKIGRLTNLEKLSIANSELAVLPDSIERLTSCTDIELYNMPNMKTFPEVISRMPALVQANLSSNPQWGETPSEYRRHDGANGNQADYGLHLLANGPSKETIQMIYMNECGMSEVTPDISNIKSLGLLDLSSNEIDKIYPFGPDIVMVQLYLDNNKLTEMPTVDTPEGKVFCGMDDVETFSVKNNLLTELPDIFTAKSNFTMTTVDFSGNRIAGVQNGKDYKGINVKTLTLSNNPMTTYPVEFAESESKIDFLNFRGCRIDSIPEAAFVGKNVKYLVSLDLSYNDLKDLPKTFHAAHMPYFYGLELSYNEFSKFPYEPLDCSGLTVFGIRGQRNDAGERCLSEWPEGIYTHKGLRGFYIGSNNLGKIDDTISPICYYLEVSDNPNIILDASSVCYEYSIGAYYLIYDKGQDIRGCEIMLQ